MNILFFGTPAFAVPSLEALASGNTVRCVTQPDRPSGRSATTRASAVATAAERLGIDCWKPEKLDDAFLEDVRQWKPDIGILAAYGKLIKPMLLDLPKNGFLNVHPSLLPRHRGASPIAGAILAGDTETGVTIMRMDEGLDTGPIVAVKRIPLTGHETCGALTATLSHLAATLLLETLPLWVHGVAHAKPQNDADATVTHVLTRADGRLDWRKPAAELEHMVRAFAPWPGTFTEGKGQLYKILRTVIGEGTSHDAPGTLVRTKDSLGAVCGDGMLLDILELQPAGKKPLTVATFLRGAPTALTRFG